MKKYLLFVLFIFSSLIAFSQKNIDGVMGIKFGSSISTVMSVAKSKGGILKKGAIPNTINFTGIKFGGRPTYTVSFQFVNNRLYQAFIFFIADKDPQTFDLYDNVLKDLVKVYGDSQATRDYKYPYDKDDEDNLIALKGGYATIYDLWVVDTNAIKLKVSESLF